MMLRGLLNVAPTFHSLQFVRTTVVVSRMFPTKLKDPQCTGPFYPKLKKQHYVYIFEEFRNWKPAGDIELILAVDVDGLGFAGDVIKVKKKIARAHLLPTGAGLYVTPENIAKTEHLRKMNEGKFCQTESAHRTLKELSGMTVSIPMNPDMEWKLNKTHVRVSFRICGVELSDDCFEMPEEEIKTPGEYFVTVVVNKMDKVQVKLNVYHYDKTTIIPTPPVWSKDPKHKFDIAEVIANATMKLQKRII